MLRRAPCGAAPPATPSPVPGPAPAPPGSDLDCSDFATRAAAQAEFDRYFPAYGDVHQLDGDGDGEACESFFG